MTARQARVGPDQGQLTVGHPAAVKTSPTRRRCGRNRVHQLPARHRQIKLRYSDAELADVSPQPAGPGSRRPASLPRPHWPRHAGVVPRAAKDTASDGAGQTPDDGEQPDAAPLAVRWHPASDEVESEAKTKRPATSSQVTDGAPSGTRTPNPLIKSTRNGVPERIGLDQW